MSQSGYSRILPSPKFNLWRPFLLPSPRRFIKYVEKTIDSRRAEAGLGGAPTKSNTIRAFVQLKLQDNPGVEVLPKLGLIPRHVLIT